MAWPIERVLNEVKVLEQQQKQFKLELMKVAWFMRGSISLDEVYSLSPEDREICSELVRENLETTKKSGMPFF